MLSNGALTPTEIVQIGCQLDRKYERLVNSFPSSCGELHLWCPELYDVHGIEAGLGLAFFSFNLIMNF